LHRTQAQIKKRFKSHKTKRSAVAPVDICLLLEGTYPYVKGGVSSWIHQLISGLPEYSFHIVFLGGEPDANVNQLYEFPKNVIGFDKYFLLDQKTQVQTKSNGTIKDPKKIEVWNTFLRFFDDVNQPICSETLLDISNSLNEINGFTLSDFLTSEASWNVLMHRDVENTRKMWIRFYEQLGLSAYYQSKTITSLFGGYQQKQILEGAPSERTKVIVNGIKTRRFDKALHARQNSPPLVIGLIGRVVPIKDIKTFIRTIFSLVEHLPNVRGLIIGPQEEDEKYVQECELLIQSLGLGNSVEMTGSQNVADILPELGAVVLTSISEAQPLVLLEAMAAGVPCVATDVGACSEILLGANDEDKAIGPCGMVVPIANPEESAAAIRTLLSDTTLWKEYGDNGRQRVTRYYEEQDMFNAYRALYEEAINGRDRV